MPERPRDMCTTPLPLAEDSENAEHTQSAVKTSNQPDSKDAHLRNLIQRGYRFAFSLTHDASDAEDLVQDAWLAALKTGHAPTIPYMLVTIRNRYIDHWRRKQVVEIVSLDTSALSALSVTDEIWEHDDNLQTDSIALDEALGKLNADERAALYLSAVEGYSAREIGDLLDKPRGTILSMIFRSRAKLRRMLAAKPEVKS